MDTRAFYKRLFAPLEETLGSIDPDTLVAIIGFDAGGPLNFCTFGINGGVSPVIYVSCELAVRREQVPSEFGRYELLASCSDEQWIRSVVSDIGRMSLESRFGDGHTMDIGPIVDGIAPIQGVIFEKVCSTRIRFVSYGVLRVVGVTRPEMEYAQEHGVPALVTRLKAADVYPDTQLNRASVV
jgi:hypothetical protein